MGRRSSAPYALLVLEPDGQRRGGKNPPGPSPRRRGRKLEGLRNGRRRPSIESPSPTSEASMATAFVFAGGGSFGAVQAGMLRGLVAHGVRPDFVVGSSAGAINCAYFAGAPDAAGVERLDALWRGLRRSEVFPITWRSLAGFFARRRAIVDPCGLRTLLERHLPYRDLREAAIPVHVVATDLLHGATVRLSEGPAVEAVL